MSAPKIDAKEYRRRYLASLSKQIAVNDKNLQANSLFKQTQQPATLEDTRTITEKTADEQSLTTLLRRELSKLTDSGSATSIVNRLSLPDKKLLLENFGGIEEALRRRFKFGFTAETFEPFFRRYMETVAETEGLPATATQIAEKIAPAVAEEQASIARAETFAEDEEKELALANVLFQLSPSQVEAQYPDRSRKWTPIRTYLQDLLRAKGENDYLDDIVKRAKSDIKTASASKYRRWFDGLSKAEQEDIANIIGFSLSPQEPSGLPPLSEAERLALLAKYGMSEQGSRASYGMPPKTGGSGIKGKGLVQAKAKTAGGIAEEARFANFGRYVIDKNDLKNGIASIRFPSGAVIPNLPKQRVSANIHNVLKKIAGGALPSYEDIDTLNKDERTYLYDISKKSRIGINIPNPKKDEETREMEDFEKMKGQIIAGNDNKDLIKKFKFTLLKLAKEGRIPKREANEVLMEMAMVGL
jgi:hypothetical protein